MGVHLGAKRPVCEINVTPLVDVVLVLLIVFMVLTPLADKEMFLRVPEYEPRGIQAVPPEAVPPDQTVLTLLSSGRVLLNSQQMTVDEAMRWLHAQYEGRPSKVLFFNAEDGAGYGLAVRVLDQAHLAGVNTIGMMTDAPLPAASAAAAPVSPAGAGPPPAPGSQRRN